MQSIQIFNKKIKNKQGCNITHLKTHAMSTPGMSGAIRQKTIEPSDVV